MAYLIAFCIAFQCLTLFSGITADASTVTAEYKMQTLIGGGWTDFYIVADDSNMDDLRLLTTRQIGLPQRVEAHTFMMLRIYGLKTYAAMLKLSILTTQTPH